MADGTDAAPGRAVAPPTLGDLAPPVAPPPAAEGVAPPPLGDLAPPVAVPLAVFRTLSVVSVGIDLPEQYPLLVLEESEGSLRRRLAFRIGVAEGVALSHALRGSRAPRPLTHDLFVEVLARSGIDVVAVRLVGRSGSTYFAELELMGSRGRQAFGCRPTDGIALALRQRVRAPILADERLLAEAGDVAAAGT